MPGGSIAYVVATAVGATCAIQGSRWGWAWWRGRTSGRIKLRLRKIQAFELITKGLYLRLESCRLLLELYAHIIPVGIR
jgi:hypothetical protein